jgi:hypothetical protein
MKYINKKLKIALSILTAIIIISAGFLLWSNPQTASATWWNDQWNYRQAIIITNNTTTEYNVFASTTLNTNTASTSMQADCGDFRFISESGEVLNFYIVSGCRTINNVVHINFTEFKAGQQTIYFYYGNPSVDNGFASADFSTQASNYTWGAVQAVETGPGPVGYWSFDEGYGATAHDSSANKNDGTITGAVWKEESECVAGKCLYFDGNGDYTEIPDFDL